MRSDKELREIFRHVSAIGLTLDHGHEVLRGCLSEAEYRRLANSPTQRPGASTAGAEPALSGAAKAWERDSAVAQPARRGEGPMNHARSLRS
jgi:hypothetical protein